MPPVEDVRLEVQIKLTILRSLLEAARRDTDGVRKFLCPTRGQVGSLLKRTFPLLALSGHSKLSHREADMRQTS
jgi:hypothetical protein